MLEQRPRLDARLAVRIDIRVIDEVARHQIDRAFDPFEFAADRACYGSQQRGFADADAALEQHVASREQRDINQAHGVVVSDYGFSRFLFEAKRIAAPILQLLVRAHRLRPRNPPCGTRCSLISWPLRRVGKDSTAVCISHAYGAACRFRGERTDEALLEASGFVPVCSTQDDTLCLFSAKAKCATSKMRDQKMRYLISSEISIRLRSGSCK